MSLQVSFAGLQQLFGRGKSNQNQPITFSGNNVKKDSVSADTYVRLGGDKGREIISTRHETD